MDQSDDRPTRIDSLRIFETGVRVALEKMLTGRDYAGVEDILRALADGSSLPTTKTDQKSFASLETEHQTEINPSPSHDECKKQR